MKKPKKLSGIPFCEYHSKFQCEECEGLLFATFEEVAKRYGDFNVTYRGGRLEGVWVKEWNQFTCSTYMTTFKGGWVVIESGAWAWEVRKVRVEAHD